MTQEPLKRLSQLKLRASTESEDSRAPDLRLGAVKSDGSFIIRGLRPGPVHLSLDFEEPSRYFSIVRMEYPDDAGQTVSILPTSTARSLKLRFLGAQATGDLPPRPPSAPTPSPESHPLPPAPLPPLPPTTSILLPVGFRGSPPPPTVSCPPLNVITQAPLVAAPSESLWPLSTGDLPPLHLREDGLNGIRLVLSYRNGSIRGHVTFKQKNLDSGRQLRAVILPRSDSCSSPTSTEIDPNGDFFIDGLAAGEYRVLIISEMKTIVVHEDSESSISFVMI